MKLQKVSAIFCHLQKKILEYNLNINDIAIEFMKKRCTDVN